MFTLDSCTPERISNLMARFSADFVATCCESWTPHDICQVLPRLKLKMARKVGARGHSHRAAGDWDVKRRDGRAGMGWGREELL